MSKKTTTTKQPRTIKVTTVIWSVVLVVMFAIGFYAGAIASNAYATNVKSDAKALVSELEESKSNQ